MPSVKSSEGQSHFDIIIQSFGSLDNIADYLNDNRSVAITNNLASGTTLQVNTDNKGEESVKEFFQNRTAANADPATAGAEGGDWGDDWNNDYN